MRRPAWIANRLERWSSSLRTMTSRGRRSMNRIVVWERLDTVGLELATFASGPLQLEGDVIVVENGEPFAVAYRVRCDDQERTASASLRVKQGGVRQQCTLERSSAGRWTLNGSEMPQLTGLVDVDLSVTPSTNTPPIRRLHLAIGQRAEVTAAWVKLPSLVIVPLRQTYRRVGSYSYEYEAPELDFAAELECDDDAVIRTY